jgi:hypothetical protein
MAGSAWAQDVESNLEGWWKFDGDALDSSGNGRHGTLVGDATLVEVGLWGGAVSLDGSGDEVTISGYTGINADRSDPDNPSQLAFTVACWIKTTGDGSLVNWGSSDGTGVGGQYQNLRIHGGRLRAEHGNGRFRGAAMVNDGEWHHVVMAVADGANLQPPGTQLYVDGVEDTEGADTVNSQNIWNLTEDADVAIGVRASHGDRRLNGMFDEVRIYSRQLTVEDVTVLALRPKSYAPDPGNGAILGTTATSLTWTPGGFAAQHAVYFGTKPELDMGDLQGFQPDTSFAVTDLEQEQTYYWRIDDVEADGTMITGDTWSFWIEPQRAYDPQPADGMINVATDVQLDWTAGWEPLMHAAYFGTDPDEVANASGAFPALETGYDPGPLEKDTTYYWRADAFYAGQWVASPVWSFTTVPEIPPIDDPNLVAWYPLDAGAGRTALDHTGNDRHGVFTGDVQWAEGIAGSALAFDGSGGDYVEAAEAPSVTGTHSRTVAAWIKTTDYGEIASWGQNVAGQKWIFRVQESNGTLGAIRVEVNGGYQVGSIDVRDDEWHHAAAVLVDDGSPNVTEIALYVDGFLESSSAQLDEPINTAAGVVRIGQSPWGSRPFVGLIDDVKIYDKAFTEDEMRQMFGNLAMAWQPQPENGTVADVLTITELSWTAGDGAVAHDVYLGSNEMAVKLADTDSVLYQGQQAETTFAPADGFAPGQPYFWRVDEVDGDGNVVAGRVWGFTITDGIIVSDVTTTIDYNNVAEPYITEVAFDVAQDWDQTGLTDLSLEIMGALPAFAVDDDGVITLSAAGNDIWGTTDQFRYAYAELAGDISMVARVVSNGSGSNTWAKGGVMIRQSLDGGSMHAFMPITGGGGQGASFQRRIDTDGSSTNADSTAVVAPPYWVKLDRAGNSFTGSISEDGENWTQLGDPVEIAMADPVLGGLAVTSHASGELRAFQFSDVSVNGEPVGVEDMVGVADVGVDHGGNDPAPMYVVVEDAAGASVVVVHPDPAATNITEWTEWRIPLDELAAAGIDLNAITKVVVGVGDGQPDGTGTVQVRNIQVVKPVANIIWVSDQYDDNQDGEPDDLPWVDLLIAQGHNVDYTPGEAMGNGYWRTLDEDKLAALNAADLVIVSRNSDSGNYDDDDEVAQWNSVTTPLILMSTHIVRNSRWKFLDTGSTNNAVPTMQAADLTHPLFAGVNVDPNAQLEALEPQNSTFPGIADAANGTVLASRVDTGEIWIAAWDAGVEYYDGAGQTAGGPRMFFVGGTQESTEPNLGRGEENLNAEGEKIFLNAVKMLLP